MSQTHRLPNGGRVDRNKVLTFTFNGQQYKGYEGDSLAAALLANGVDVIGRSFKYSRPRGIFAAGAEEPNAVLQIGATEATQIPNVRATQQALYQGLVATSTNGWPNVNTDVMGILGKVGGKLMPPGFYYKTFMYPQSFWMTYEKYIRKAAGLGRSPTQNDPDTYDYMNHHCDVLIVGAGPAGLAAALAAARSGARVIVADEQEEFGGSLLDSRESLDGKPAMEWVAGVIAALKALPDVLLLPRATVNGYHDHNFLTIHERLTDHLGDRAPIGQVRQRDSSGTGQACGAGHRRVRAAAGVRQQRRAGQYACGCGVDLCAPLWGGAGRKLVLSTRQRPCLSRGAGLARCQSASGGHCRCPQQSPRCTGRRSAGQRHPDSDRQRRDRNPRQQTCHRCPCGGD